MVAFDVFFIHGRINFFHENQNRNNQEQCNMKNNFDAKSVLLTHSGMRKPQQSFQVRCFKNIHSTSESFIYSSPTFTKYTALVYSPLLSCRQNTHVKLQWMTCKWRSSLRSPSRDEINAVFCQNRCLIGELIDMKHNSNKKFYACISHKRSCHNHSSIKLHCFWADFDKMHCNFFAVAIKVDIFLSNIYCR